MTSLLRGRRVVAALAILSAAAAANCREPTEILVEITTDVPCTDLRGITLTVGALGGGEGVEERAPTAQTSHCDEQTGRIGSLMVIPSGEKTDLVAIKVVAGSKMRLAEDCRAPSYGPECIVARRALRFVPSTQLHLPVLLRASCLGTPCAPLETCVKGTCLPAEISDSNACETGCDESVLGDAGPPPRDASTADTSHPDVVDAGPPFCDEANADIVGCYPFEGTVHDDSRYNQQPSTATNVQFETGRVGKAARFVSTATTKSLVTIPYGTNGAAWNSMQITLEAWVRPMSLPAPDGGTGRAGVIDNNNRFGLFYYPDGRMLCRVVDVTGYGATVPLGAWTHFACVWDSGVVTYYVNGAPTGPTVAVGSPAQSIDPADGMNIGSDSPSGADNFDGYVDELRLWRIARKPADIAAAAQRGR